MKIICDYYGKDDHSRYCFSFDYGDIMFIGGNIQAMEDAMAQTRIIYKWLTDNAGPIKKNAIMTWLFGENERRHETIPSMYGFFIYIKDDAIATAFKLRFT